MRASAVVQVVMRGTGGRAVELPNRETRDRTPRRSLPASGRPPDGTPKDRPHQQVEIAQTISIAGIRSPHNIQTGAASVHHSLYFLPYYR